MNKEIKDRLDKLENEVKESKIEIHSLKNSVSLTIERGIIKLLSRFSRKQIILGSMIVLFSISIIGIAGTVTKTYTFSSGDVVSASKINTNFDTLFTLVNGNIDDNNISGISGSKITSGTVAAARIDNLSASMITSGKLSSDRLDTISDSKIYGETIVFYLTSTKYDGNLGGRSGADAKCDIAKKYSLLTMAKTNIRAFMSISATDEIRDMVSNYNVPSNAPIISPFGTTISDNISDHLDGDITKVIRKHFIKDYIEQYAYTGSTYSGALSSYNCANWTSTTAGNGMGQVADFDSTSSFVGGSGNNCSDAKYISCIAF